MPLHLRSLSVLVRVCCAFIAQARSIVAFRDLGGVRVRVSAVLSSECLSVLSPLFVAMQSFELFLMTSLEIAAACLSELVVMFLFSTEFCSHVGARLASVFPSEYIPFLNAMVRCSFVLWLTQSMCMMESGERCWCRLIEEPQSTFELSYARSYGADVGHVPCFNQEISLHYIASYHATSFLFTRQADKYCTDGYIVRTSSPSRLIIVRSVDQISKVPLNLPMYIHNRWWYQIVRMLDQEDQSAGIALYAEKTSQYAVCRSFCLLSNRISPRAWYPSR